MESADVATEVVGGIRPVEEAIASGQREVFKLVVAKGLGTGFTTALSISIRPR